MTVKLFKNSKVDGVTRLGNWSSKTEQINYFDTLVSKTYEVPTVKLGAPLRINDKLNNLLGYGYGCIDYGDGFRYYFSVADLEMVTETITNISYTIDVWDTAKCQTNMTVKRSVLSRYRNRVGKEYYPRNPRYTYYEDISITQPRMLAFVGTDSKNQSLRFVVVTAITTNGIKQLTADISGNFWLSQFAKNTYFGTNDPLKFEASDIWVASIVPFAPNVIGGTNWEDITSYFTSGYTSSDFKVLMSTTFNYPISGTSIYGMDADECTIGSNYVYETTVIKDMRGTDVFECEQGATYEIQGVDVAFSISSIQNILRYKCESESLANPEFINIVVPCENVDVLSDSYKEYYYRQRTLDIESRQMQVNQQLVSSLANTSSSAIGGAIAGGPVGAVAGAGLGAISAVGNYAISAYYAPKEQAIVDRQAFLTKDTLVQTGNTVAYYMANPLCGRFYKKWDRESITMYNNDCSNNGYYCDYAIDNLDDYLVNGPIKATVEVQGDIPIVWKEQITNRFANGVYLV